MIERLIIEKEVLKDDPYMRDLMQFPTLGDSPVFLALPLRVGTTF